MPGCVARSRSRFTIDGGCVCRCSWVLLPGSGTDQPGARTRCLLAPRAQFPVLVHVVSGQARNGNWKPLPFTAEPTPSPLPNRQRHCSQTSKTRVAATSEARVLPGRDCQVQTSPPSRILGRNTACLENGRRKNLGGARCQHRNRLLGAREQTRSLAVGGRPGGPRPRSGHEATPGSSSSTKN